MARVLVVEDDPFTRMLLSSQLRELGYEVVGEASGCAEGIASFRVTLPDVVLVDLDLGSGPNGVDLAYRVRAIRPEIGILLLTTYVDIRLIGDFRPLPEGTVFMVKRSLGTVEVLRSAIALAIERPRKQVKGGRHEPSRISRLRDGQIEIMRLVAAGYTNAEIANRRFLTEGSVAKAISRLLDQLGLTVTPEHNPRVLITQSYFSLMSGSVLPDV